MENGIIYINLKNKSKKELNEINIIVNSESFRNKFLSIEGIFQQGGNNILKLTKKEPDFFNINQLKDF